jgi:hypothetical protein
VPGSDNLVTCSVSVDYGSLKFPPRLGSFRFGWAYRNTAPVEKILATFEPRASSQGSAIYG